MTTTRRQEVVSYPTENICDDQREKLAAEELDTGVVPETRELRDREDSVLAIVLRGQEKRQASE